ncbi:hypothetical protein [Paludisphaera soli]|uniref:hypothetical protein n=1 Tax=Paludisphaera soli TaxID=2712865 RepID=UPI0013E9A006|nr:hypothetical protein [Paludisphaera soli]
MSLIDDPDFGDGKAYKFGKAPAGTPPVRAWTLVMVANLPVPLTLGMIVTDAGGRLGMACGVALIYWLGLHACRVARQTMVAVVRGGSVVAAFQILPVLQMAAGMAGVILASVVGSARFHVFPHVDAIVDGFLATVATGAILIAVSAALGSLREFETSTRPSST